MTTAHLDEGALSAAVDGAATAEEEAHLSGCWRCQAQVASLAVVARAVGVPVAPRPGAEVDDAIEQALRGWASAQDGAWSAAERDEALATAAGDADSVGDSFGPNPRAVDFNAVAAPSRRHRAGGRSGKRRGGSSSWLVAAAGIASAVVVVGGIVALTRLTSGSTTARTASLAPTISSTTAPFPGTRSGGDLGIQSDPGEVARLVLGALSPASTTAGGNATAAPEVGGSTVAGRAPPAGQLPPSACAAQARAALGLASDGSAPVRLVAPLRWRGQPAVVVVFSRPAGLAGVIMNAADCSKLVDLPL